MYFRISLILGALLLNCGPYAYAYEIDLNAIAQIESSGNQGAIEDSGRSLGLYQIQKAVVKDYNLATKHNFTHRDMLDPVKAKIVASWNFKRLARYADTEDEAIIGWNCGIGYLIKWKKYPWKGIPETTRKYIEKYHRLKKACVDAPSIIR